MKQDFFNWLALLCQYNQKDQTYYDQITAQLLACPDILEEFDHYRLHKEFLDQVKIEGYGITDILVWQIDHFKSHMDRGEYNMQSDPDHMILMAFETMLKMKKDPTPYRLAMQSETGTDYPEKY